MTCKVTFDSNVWRQVSSPGKFADDPDIAVYQAIRAACEVGDITGFLSETTFTLEQINRDERLKWLLESQQISIKESCPAPDVVRLNMSIGPSDGTTLAEIQMVKDHLEDAYELGIRLLRSNRVAGPISPLLQDDKYFLGYADENEFHKYNNENGKISHELEKMGFGIKNLKRLGEAKCTKRYDHWLKGMSNLTSAEEQMVPELIAEWADTDAVATSIAHGVSFFCSNDIGKGASGKGVNSIMTPTNSAQITARYGLEFITPKQLLSRMTGNTGT